MPTRATIEAATPKCPCSLAEGPTQRRCATGMRWHVLRDAWVCERHPHMNTAPDGTTRLAPRGTVRGVLFDTYGPFPTSDAS